MENWLSTGAGSKLASSGLRNVFAKIPRLAELGRDARVTTIANHILGAPAFVVRELVFDKRRSANWLLEWHQDLMIPLAAASTVPAGLAVAMKAGVPHVKATAEVLEHLIALRIFLDDATPENGALRVLPGSHREGVLTDEQVRAWPRRADPYYCTGRRGSVLAMRPLLLHASSHLQTCAQRRVLHLECAAQPLPDGMTWHQPLASSKAR